MDDAHSSPFVWWKSNTVHTHTMFIDISRHHAVKHLQCCMLWLEDLHVWSITFSDYVFVYPPCWLAGHTGISWPHLALRTVWPSESYSSSTLGSDSPDLISIFCVFESETRKREEEREGGGRRVSKVRGEKTDTIWQRLCLWWEAEISYAMFLECVFVCLWSVCLQNTLFYWGH